ncbi:hypothetical protein FALCPG4_015405 [Fusarium falciforme]
MKGFPPGDYINLTLNGVKKPSHAQKFIVTIHGPWYMTLKQVIQLLEEHKFEAPVSAKHARLAVPNWNPNKAMPREFQILAIDGRSCYDMNAESGLLINRDEPIGRFTDTLRRLRIRCQEGKVVATSFPAQLEITFNRTLRLPEDGKIHNQPSGVGHIPVTNIACIAEKLRNSGNASLRDMARKGGVFFPMYQREAMFMSFKATKDSFAVRPFVGGVNAVSGLPWNAPQFQRLPKQDYVSVPPQEFVDGIDVGQDTVKQFIAMPLGSDYSVEKQVTSKEDVGGMQLEIIPGNQWRVGPQGVEDASPYDTPRSLNTDIVVLSWTNLELKKDSALDLSQSAGYIYPQPNVAPGFIPWQPGADVYMAAIYRLNITLTYVERGIHCTMSVEWPPWWTVEACFQERAQAGVKVMGKFFDEGNFGLLYQGRLLGSGSLQDQGMEDNSIIQVVNQAVSPRPMNPYLNEDTRMAHPPPQQHSLFASAEPMSPPQMLADYQMPLELGELCQGSCAPLGGLPGRKTHLGSPSTMDDWAGGPPTWDAVEFYCIEFTN